MKIDNYVEIQRKIQKKLEQRKISDLLKLQKLKNSSNNSLSVASYSKAGKDSAYFI